MMTEQEYRAHPALNWSRLKQIETSPLHMQYADTVPSTETTSTRIGSAVHCLALEPERWDAEFATYTGKVRRGKEWQAFSEAHPGKVILTQAELTKAQRASLAILGHSVAGPLVTGDGPTEQAVFWADKRGMVPCKARLDKISTEAGKARLIEIKTTYDADPRRFASTVVKYGYHGQLAWYQRALDWSATHNDTDPEPALIVVESSPPHDVIVYRIPADVMDAGRKLCDELLDKYKACIAANAWPGRAPDNELCLELPSWAMTDDMPLVTMGGEAVAW